MSSRNAIFARSGANNRLPKRWSLKECVLDQCSLSTLSSHNLRERFLVAVAARFARDARRARALLLAVEHRPRRPRVHERPRRTKGVPSSRVAGAAGAAQRGPSLGVPVGGVIVVLRLARTAAHHAPASPLSPPVAYRGEKCAKCAGPGHGKGDLGSVRHTLRRAANLETSAASIALVLTIHAPQCNWRFVRCAQALSRCVRKHISASAFSGIISSETWAR